MSRSAVFSALLAVSAASALVGEPRDAVADTAKPPVSILAARKIVLTRVPGTIVNEKLKTKHNKPPTWSIKVRPRGVPETSDRLVKVEVDANLGTILKVKEIKARKQDED